jgi:hypothetical protein
LYANQQDANKFIFKGNFPIPRAACPDWFQHFSITGTTLSPVVRALYYFIEALCGLSSFEFQLDVERRSGNTSAGTISPQNTYLQVNSSNGIKNISLKDLNDAVRDASICAINCELCKSQNRCSSNSACASGYCKNGSEKTSMGCKGTCMVKLHNGGDCSKDALNISPNDPKHKLVAGDPKACRSGECTCGRCTDSSISWKLGNNRRCSNNS